MSDEESDLDSDAEDDRIEQIMDYEDGHSPEETVAYADELGGKDAIM